jgi:hypothetical protein
MCGKMTEVLSGLWGMLQRVHHRHMRHVSAGGVAKIVLKSDRDIFKCPGRKNPAFRTNLPVLARTSK